MNKNEYLDAMYNRIPKANMLTRYLYGDGVTGQQERMIRDKRKTLSRALLYSYQAAYVKKLYDDNDTIERRALINPDKVKQDYDEKIISIGFESNFKTGDIFQWLGTNTYWLIYLQDLTELAYFRGNIDVVLMKLLGRTKIKIIIKLMLLYVGLLKLKLIISKSMKLA